MTQETQESICAWVEQTFGPASSNIRVAIRAQEECFELLEKLVADDRHQGAAEEAADVVIVLYRLAGRNGYQLSEIVEVGIVDSRLETNLQLATCASAHLAKAIHMLSLADDRLPEVELGDTVLALEMLVSNLGSSMQREVCRKMAINRKRVWRLDGTGHGYHVPQQVAAE